MISIPGCDVHVVVTERPVDELYDRPIAPGQIIFGSAEIGFGQVADTYGTRGCWERRRESRVWQEGHWNQHGRGYRWECGHW